MGRLRAPVQGRHVLHWNHDGHRPEAGGPQRRQGGQVHPFQVAREVGCLQWSDDLRGGVAGGAGGQAAAAWGESGGGELLFRNRGSASIIGGGGGETLTRKGRVAPGLWVVMVILMNSSQRLLCTVAIDRPT